MMANDKFERFAEEFEAAWNEDLRAADVRAMVMGPSLRGRADPETKRARMLRKAIVERCNVLGVAVVPEHKRLVATTQKSLARGHNLCLHELRLAAKCDLIIIVPASAGPLVELGMFAERQCLTGKAVLIVFNRTYKRRKSFINDGPRRAYERLRATILDVDYTNESGLARVLDMVGTLVEYERATKVSRRTRRI
jgi:hypothetical protein